MAIEETGEPGDPTSYDRIAGVYDRMVRSRAYNAVAWSTSPRAYEAFAHEALAAGDGPVLEAFAGSAASTAVLHAASGRDTVLVDLSRGMLKRAESRIADESGDLPERIRLVRADVLNLPFAAGGFETVLVLGATHLFEDLGPLRAALLAQLAPGGRLFIAGLVGETRRGRAYLRALHRAGEVAPPVSADELRAALRPERFRIDGCMAFAVLRAPG